MNEFDSIDFIVIITLDLFTVSHIILDLSNAERMDLLGIEYVSLFSINLFTVQNLCFVNLIGLKILKSLRSLMSLIKSKSQS